jgi:hypothetical protein
MGVEKKAGQGLWRRARATKEDAAGLTARRCSAQAIDALTLSHGWCANGPDTKGSLDIGDVVVNGDSRRSREEKANRFQAAVHEQASRVAARGHDRRQDLVTKQSNASGSVTDDNGRIHRDHNSHRYLGGTTRLDHECADARLVHT